MLHLLLHDFVPAAIPTYTDLDMPEPGTQRPIFPDVQLSDLVERLETKFPNLRGDERMLTKITDLVDTDKDGTVDYIEWCSNRPPCALGFGRTSEDIGLHTLTVGAHLSQVQGLRDYLAGRRNHRRIWLRPHLRR